MIRGKVLGPLLLLSLLSLLSSCDRMGRVRECRRVARLVNERFDAIGTTANQGTPAAFASAAAAYVALGKEVRKSPYPGEAGRAVCEDYAGILEQVAPAVSAYGEALRSKDTVRIDEARRSLSRLKKTERSAAARMDAHCSQTR